MRTAAQATSAAEREARKSCHWLYNLCLKFVRSCWGIPATGIPDANAAWAKAQQRKTDRNPPAGAPVYWAVGRYGHAALSAGGGLVYSTDIRRKGKVDLVPLGEIERAWRATYLGWSADYAGRSLPVQTTPQPQPGKDFEPFPGAAWLKTRPNSPIITAMGKRLAAEGCSVYSKGPGPQWSEADRRSYARWQAKLGYTGSNADGWPGRKSWDALKIPRTT